MGKQQAFLLLEDYLKVHFPFAHLNKSEVEGQLVVDLESNIEKEPLRKYILDSTFCFIYRELSIMMRPDLIQLRLPYSHLQPYRDKLKQNILKYKTHRFSFDIKLVNKKVIPNPVLLHMPQKNGDNK